MTAKQWREAERDNIAAAITAANGRIYGKGGAADLLGMKPTTLMSKIDALGIRRRS